MGQKIAMKPPMGAVLFAVALLGLAGCVVPGTGTGSTPGQASQSDQAANSNGTPGQSPSRAEAPVDPSIQVESISRPGPAAEEAIDLCNAVQYGLDKIARLGQIPHARDAIHYVPLEGIEPEIQTDSPAFIIQFSGEIPQPKYNGETWVDPICVVVDGRPGFYATGPRILVNGVKITPEPIANKPDWSLPQPAP